MCIDKEFTKSLLENMIACLEVAHDCYVDHIETCHNKCGEFFLSYELLVQHMKGIYTKTKDENGNIVREPERDWDALIHSIGQFTEVD